MSRDKYFKGYNPDFVSAYGKRDWQKDMEDCEKALKAYEVLGLDEELTEPIKATMHWLQLAAELATEQAYAKQQATMWNDKAVEEKERANKLYTDYRAAKEEIARLNVTYYADHQRFIDQRRELALEKERADKAEHSLKNATYLVEYANARLKSAEAREQKLREAEPLDEWHEDIGAVLWWTFPIEEPPYCGSPLDSEWPGYHTHWTQIVTPESASLYPKEEEA